MFWTASETEERMQIKAKDRRYFTIITAEYRVLITEIWNRVMNLGTGSRGTRFRLRITSY